MTPTKLLIDKLYNARDLASVGGEPGGPVEEGVQEGERGDAQGLIRGGGGSAGDPKPPEP